jgi:glycerol-3-phosphate acyltransferase PlsY
MAAEIALLVPAGYVLGSMPWGYWLPRLVAGIDVRRLGSGNTGAANVWRVAGFRLGLGVAALDVAKGLAAALLGLWVGGDLAGLVAGISAMVGHWRPLFLRFARGGKIVATTAGVGLALAPFAALAAAGVWVLVFLTTRYSSVASLLSAVALAVFAAVFGASTAVVVFTAGAAAAIVVLHRANLGRLARGTENRFDRFRFRADGRMRPAGEPPEEAAPLGKATN